MPIGREEALRFKKALDHIWLHPKEWDQGIWWCDTGGCIAGHVTITVCGGIPFVPKPFISLHGYLEREADDPEGDVQPVTALTSEGQIIELPPKVPVSLRAQRLLGLDAMQAAILFQADNTMKDLIQLYENWTGLQYEPPTQA